MVANINENKREQSANNAVIYARSSSSSQTKQSIDGQLRVCSEYAKKQGYHIVNEYVDRAKTGTNANRQAFQKMIADSEKKQFQVIIVYMLDRFARSKEDSVVYKSMLKRNGVKVLSATEQIGDSDEGYLVEGLLEMFAEQYSTKLSKRVKNGLIESRINGNFTGGNILFGFKAENKKVVIDKDKAPIIRSVFEDYANGKPKKIIVDELNKRGVRTNKGNKFTINSLYSALRNKKYIGQYYFKGECLSNCYPILIDPTVFERVQKKLDQVRHAPATTKAKVEYQLYGKTFCGHCGGNMVGIGGTSKTGKVHHYYACATQYKQHTCDKKYEIKDTLEAWIIANVQNYILLKENAERIADLILLEYNNNINTAAVRELDKQINRIDRQFDDITNLMLQNVKNNDLIVKLNNKADDFTQQKNALQTERAKLSLAIALPHSKADIIKYLAVFFRQSTNNAIYRKCLIDRLINTIYIYNDKIIVYFSILDDRHISFDMLPDSGKVQTMQLTKNVL